MFLFSHDIRFVRCVQFQLKGERPGTRTLAACSQKKPASLPADLGQLLELEAVGLNSPWFAVSLHKSGAFVKLGTFVVRSVFFFVLVFSEECFPFLRCWHCGACLFWSCLENDGSGL